jgi:methionine synthase II (cobalamin-independent)
VAAVVADLIKIIDVILKAKPAGILFEAANSRHAHEWAVWAKAALPQDKVLIPGLIDSCSNSAEHPPLAQSGLTAARLTAVAAWTRARGLRVQGLCCICC